MRETQVLIVSFSDDVHVPLVTRHLDKISVPWTLLATDTLGEGTTLTFDSSRGITLETPSGDVDLGGVQAVWNRRRLINPGGTRPSNGGSMRDQYVHEQRKALLDGMLRHVPGRWINKPSALRSAGSKLDQLVQAKQLGLRIPATVATDDPRIVRRFCERFSAEGVITKVVTPGTPLVRGNDRQYMVFTQSFESTAVSDKAIAAAPAIYQQRLAKLYEARTIVIGDEVLTCRIDSQASTRTALDWRHYDFDAVAHTPMTLPAELTNQLRALCTQYGLIFAAIDLAYTAAGWVFLEINPNGQWGWLEEQASLPVGKTLSEELARSA